MPDQDRRNRTEAGAPVMEAAAWADAIRRGETPQGIAIRRAEVDVVRAVDEGSRTIEIVAGTSNVVRDSMAILVEGYDLTQYRRNPVVAWSHNYWEPPVASCVEMRVENGVFICRDEFVPAEISPFADMLWRMYSHPRRFLRAASIGLNPLEHETRNDVLTVTRSEVMEHSLCLIGVDPNCLTLARSEGINLHPLDEWARRCLDEGGHVVIPRDRAEAIVRTLGYGNGLALFSLDPAAIEALRSAKPADETEGEPEAEPEVQDAMKPKPHQREDGEDDMSNEDGMPMADEEEERCDDGEDLILLEDDDEPAAEDEDAEIEVDEEELRAAITSAVSLALAAHAPDHLRAEAR